MSEHSLLSASASDRWLACPISVLGPESKSSEAAAEGTLGHLIAEEALRDGKPYPAAGTQFTVEGYTFTITDGFINDVDAYVQHIRSVPWIGAYTPERRVNYSRSLAAPYNLAFGTTDCNGFSQDASGRYLEIADLKMGRVPVSAVRSPQMTLYAAGVLDDMYPHMVLPRSHLVRFTIFQPRLSHRPFQWVTTVGWIEDTVYAMRPAAHAAIAYKQNTATQATWVQFPELPGEHCKYCTRKPQCQAFQKHLAKAAQPGTVVQWDARMFALRGVVADYFKDLEKLAYDAAMAGAPYPGTKLVKGRAGNPVLQQPLKAVREIAKGLGLEEAVVRMEEVWSTPAAIRDAFIRYGVQPVDVQRIVQSPEGAPQLASADDPRPEIKRGADTTAFGGVPLPQ